MKKRLGRIGTGGLRAILLLALHGAAAAQEDQQQPQTLPPSTNPAQRFIYPSEGQDEQLQMTDQLACYRWATQQMGAVQGSERRAQCFPRFVRWKVIPRPAFDVGSGSD